MRPCCALVSVLGVCAALSSQARSAKVFPLGEVLESLENKTGAVPGDVRPDDRLLRLLHQGMQREVAERRLAIGDVVMRRGGNARDKRVIIVEGDTGLVDVVQSVLDEMRRDPLPRFHLTCTVLVMPWEIAAAHGLATNVEEADMVAMTKLMRDVVKARGTLLNLPETIATPFVPFVAEPRAAAEGKQAPKDDGNLRLRGEALAVSPEEVLFGVQLVRGSLPEDRTVVPKAPVIDRAFRLRVGTGVTLTAKDDKTATVLWLRFTGTSTVTPKADKTDKADTKDENGKR